jgi:hypothetical protein
VKIELDGELVVAKVQGREGWLREARRQLEEHRRREARPIGRSLAGGYWRQSDGSSKTSRSSAKRTRRTSATARTGATSQAAAQSPTEAISPPHTLRERSTRPIKKLGVSAQREIELSVREPLEAGELRGEDTLEARATIALSGLPRDVVVTGTIALT